MPNDLDEFMEAVGLRNQQINDRIQNVLTMNAQNNKDIETVTNTINAQGKDSQVVTAAKEYAALDAQNKTQALATKLGINPDGASEVLDKVADEWKVSKLDAIATQQKLHDDVNIRFLDHPLDYISAQIGLEGTLQRAELASKRERAATSAMADIQNLTQQIPLQMAALAKTRTDATVQATLDGVSQLTAQKAAEARLQNSGLQLQGIQALNSMTLDQLNMKSSVINMKRQEEGLQLQRESLAQQKKMFDLNYQDRQDRIAQQKADRAELEDTANIVRKGAAVMGYQDIAAFPTARIISMLQSKQANIQDFFKAGMSSMATDHPVISDDAGDAIRMINQHGAPLRPEQASIKKFAKEVWYEAAQPNNGLKYKYDPTKVDQVTRGASAIANVKAAEQMKNVTSGGQDNIYAPPPLPSVTSLPAIKNSNWYKNVLEPQMTTGALKEFNPEQLVSMTVVAIKSGKVSFNDAQAGLQGMFNGAVSLNNLTKNYPGVGLPLQKGFKTLMPNGLGFDRSYDLTTPQDISNLLNSKLSNFNKAARPVLESRAFGLD